MEVTSKNHQPNENSTAAFLTVKQDCRCSSVHGHISKSFSTDTTYMNSKETTSITICGKFCAALFNSGRAHHFWVHSAFSVFFTLVSRLPVGEN